MSFGVAGTQDGIMKKISAGEFFASISMKSIPAHPATFAI
jgi:hypothetical protein